MPVYRTLVEAFDLLKDFIHPPLWEKVRPYVARIDSMCGGAMDLVISTHEIIGIHSFFCVPELHFNLTFGEDSIDVIVQSGEDGENYFHVIRWDNLDEVLDTLNKTDKDNVLDLIEFLESVEV